MRIGAFNKKTAVFAVLVGVIGMCHTAFADATFSTDKASVIGTGSADSVYKITIDDYQSGDALTYSIDGGSEQTADISSGTATIGSSFSYGVHSIDWKITNGSDTRYSKVEDFTVMKLYEKQFLDEFNNKGVATHMSRITVDEHVVNLLNSAGIKTIRDGMTWYNVERSTNAFDYNSTDIWMDKLYDNDISMTAIWGFNNVARNTHPILNHHTGKFVTGVGYLPRYQKDIEPFITYVDKSMERYDYLNQFELWNEPNGANLAAADYVDLAMNTITNIKQKDRWADLSVLSLMDFRSSDWTRENFKSGIYPYMDSIAFHPYVQSAADTGAQEAKCDDMLEQITENGGWKGLNITEVGWTTYKNGTTEENQAVQLVKQALLSDKYDLIGNYWYDFIDDGTDENDKEHFFGIVDNSQNPKPSYVSFTQMNSKTAGSLYLGELELDGAARALVYLKDNKPLVVAWVTSGEGELSTSVSSAKVEDIYGNEITYTNQNIPLTTSPVYISGLEDSFLNRAVSDEIARETSDWEFSDVSDSTKTLINTAINANIANSGDNDNKAGLESVQDAYKAAGIAVIADAKNGTISAKRASSILFELYRPLRYVNRLYARRYAESDVQINSDIDGAIALSNERYYDNFYMMTYSEAILRYAHKYNNDAKTVKAMENHDGKNGVVAAWDRMSCILIDWFKELSSFEEKFDYGLFMNIGVVGDSYTDIAENGKEREVAVTVVNESNSDFNGTLIMYDANGTELYRTKKAVNVKKGEYTVKLARFTPNASTGKYMYTFKLVDDKGNVHNTREHEIYIYSEGDESGYPDHSGKKNYTNVMYPTNSDLSTKAIESSDERYVFEIGGRRFVLLDKDNDGNYFVAADEVYTSRGFNTTNYDLTANDNWKYDVYNSTNVAYWLNNDFLQNGAKLGSTQMALPDAIKNSLREFTWTVEGLDDANIDEYTVTSKLALMSATEWFYYADKLGFAPSNAPYAYPDENGKNTYIVPSTGQKTIHGWYLRTPIGGPVYGCFVSVAKYDSMPGLLALWSIRSGSHYNYIRPVFWLNSDFFDKNKSNITSVGELVQTEMK